MSNIKKEILEYGLHLMVDDLCQNPDIFKILKSNLMRKEACRIGGKSILFSEDDVAAVLSRLEDAILSLATESEPDNTEENQSERETSGKSEMTSAPDNDQESTSDNSGQGAIGSWVRKDIFEEISFRNMSIKAVRFEGEDLPVYSAQDMIDALVYPLLRSKTSSVIEDIKYLRDHTGLIAREYGHNGLRNYRKSLKTGLYLPCVNIDQSMKVARKIARLLGGKLEVDAVVEGRPGHVTYFYDPTKVTGRNNSESVSKIACAAGRFFRLRYEDNGETRAYYILRPGELSEKTKLPEDIEAIGNGQPIVSAVEGCEAGEVASIEINGNPSREVRILEVWENA